MQQPKLLDRVRNTARLRHLSHKTEDANVNFIKRYIVFHKKGRQGVKSPLDA